MPAKKKSTAKPAQTAPVAAPEVTAPVETAPLEQIATTAPETTLVSEAPAAGTIAAAAPHPEADAASVLWPAADPAPAGDAPSDDDAGDEDHKSDESEVDDEIPFGAEKEPEVQSDVIASREVTLGSDPVLPTIDTVLPRLADRVATGYMTTSPHSRLTGPQAELLNRMFQEIHAQGGKVNEQGDVLGWFLDQVAASIAGD